MFEEAEESTEKETVSDENGTVSLCVLKNELIQQNDQRQMRRIEEIEDPLVQAQAGVHGNVDERQRQQGEHLGAKAHTEERKAAALSPPPEHKGRYDRERNDRLVAEEVEQRHQHDALPAVAVVHQPALDQPAEHGHRQRDDQPALADGPDEDHAHRQGQKDAGRFPAGLVELERCPQRLLRLRR